MAEKKVDGRSKIARLRTKADKIGITYTDNTSEEALEEAIEQWEDANADAPPVSGAPAPSQASVDIVALGKVMADQMGNAIRTANLPHSDDGLVDMRDADPDDEAPEKIYFHPASWWILPAKRIGGQRIKAPFGRIVFKMDTGSSVLVGGRHQTKYQSVFRTKSKKEQAYMDTHEMYRKFFFWSDDSVAASSMEVAFAERYAAHVNNLNAKQSAELFAIGADLGLKLTRSMALPVLRSNIAEELTKREAEVERERERQLIVASSRGDLLSIQPQ